MRNRWFHAPLLHTRDVGIEKKASWLELFYDLIFVAAFVQIGNGLSADVSVRGVLLFAAVFAPLWVTWSGFTFYVNRFTIDDFVHRTTVLMQMFAVGGMAISAPGVAQGKIAPFSIAAGVSQLLIAAMHARAFQQVKEARGYAAYWGSVFAVAGGAWLVAGQLAPTAAYAVWGAATVAVLAAPLSPKSRALTERHPLDFQHLGERYGLLTIFVLGESFVTVLSELVAKGAGVERYLEGGVVLLLTAGIWWVYFDDVAGAKIRKGPGKWVIWLYAHVPLQMAMTASGVAMKKATSFAWLEPAPEAYRWLLAGSLGLVYLSVAAVDSVTERKQAELSDRNRVNSRIFSGLVLLTLAPAGRSMTGGVFLGLVAAVNVAQVAFDMMMAPFEMHEQAEQGARMLHDMARERGENEAPARIRRDISEAVRKGTPTELRRDLYFYFIEGSWTRVFVAFAFLFFIANVFFAALFAIEPGSIGGSRPRSFADAFAFSVQTMSTIGYGGLSPATPYGNAIVAVEAAVSIIGTAIVTGLVFAKASRPKSSVLWSRNILATKMDGKQVVIFRVGNARGNEIVDATMSVTAVVEEMTAEGHHMRTLKQLELRRARSPLFVLSWLIIHEVDENSPLANVDFEHPERSIIAFVATIMGHDSTYGQTTYSRYNYQAEHLLNNHRFADIISELPDGRLMIDYTKFHDVVPETETDSD